LPRDWNQRYAELPSIDLTPEPLLVEVADLLAPGAALDLACGPGRHALHLARCGWRVTAVDASAVAIRLLRDKARGLPIDARVADLEAGEFIIEPGIYDLVCDFYYLQRDLFPAIREGLRPGGVFAGAIHLFEDTPEGRAHNPAWLVRPGELRELFAGWKVLYYSEAAVSGERRRAARIIVRRA
jgi:tellurite methyltransferase